MSFGRSQNVADAVRTPLELLANDRRTATASGTGVDIRDFDGRVKLIAQIGNTGGTTPTLNIKVQESDDNNVADPWADVTGGAFTEITADGVAVLDLDLTGVERWVRIVATIAGTSPTFDFGVVLFGGGHVLPTG